MLKYSEFIKLGNKFYHFSESALKPGDILKSKICDNQVYLDSVMPIYKEVAKEHGFEWPVCHGYCFIEPKFISTVANIESYKENDMKNTICYEIVADADIHIGAIDRSAMYTTMLLEGKAFTYANVETYAREYFMNPPTTYKEAICSRFRVIGALERSEWTVEKPSLVRSHQNPAR